MRELAKPPVERLKWLMWTDADTVVLNPSFELEAFLPPSMMQEVELICNKDQNGLNNGIFFIKVSQGMAAYMAQVAAYPHFHPEADLSWPEQQAMQYVLNDTERYHEKVVYMPQHLFNAYGGAKPGDYLIHFAGREEARVPEMKDWLSKVEGEQWIDWDRNPWTIESMERIMEIRRFWSVLHSFRKIATSLNDDFILRHNLTTFELENSISWYKSVTYFDSDEEEKMMRALIRLEEEVSDYLDVSLPVLLNYNERWRYRGTNGSIQLDAFDV